MKPPDDPTPSGDRTMARSFRAALALHGHDVELVSRLRTHLHAPDESRQKALTERATHEAQIIGDAWAAVGPPDLWFTYHNYHKAPDLLGPQLARQFGFPYALAEGSQAAKRASAWGHWFVAAEIANRAADLHVCMTLRDRECIEPLLGRSATLVMIPPFLACAGEAGTTKLSSDKPVRLVTVAMMRAGDKFDSYRFLAAALAGISDRDWHLDVVGDGQARAAVEAAFAPVDAARITWHGECRPDEVRQHLRQADLFVWPGFGEAFGLAYLEAQAAGLPVVALDVAGVSSVVVHDRTGLLVAGQDPDGFGRAVRSLIDDPHRRSCLGREAAAFVRNDRSLAAAASVLDTALQATLACRQKCHVE